MSIPSVPASTSDRLQGWHSQPRNLPVSWSWSRQSGPKSEPQYSQRPSAGSGRAQVLGRRRHMPFALGVASASAVSVTGLPFLAARQQTTHSPFAVLRSVPDRGGGRVAPGIGTSLPPSLVLLVTTQSSSERIQENPGGCQPNRGLGVSTPHAKAATNVSAPLKIENAPPNSRSGDFLRRSQIEEGELRTL